MANEKSSPTKSDRVRQYLAKKPTASVHQIVLDLEPYGVSEALAGKIKYSETREAPEPTAKMPRPIALTASPAPGTKADGMEGKKKKRRRRRKTVAGSATIVPNSAGLNIDDLVAAKKLVGQVGSIEKVKEALTALARLG
jgi:hypothetical protein